MAEMAKSTDKGAHMSDIEIEKCKHAMKILELLPTPVMAIDTKFNVTFMNPAGARIVGRRAEACVGQKCFNLFKADDCHTAECACGNAMREGRIFSEDTIAKVPAGDLPIRYTGAPIKDDAGNIVGAVQFAADISVRQQVIEEVRGLVKAVAEGKLDARGNPDKYKVAGFRSIIEGVNEILDGLTGPLNVAADYVDRISKGAIPEKITDEYKGDFNEIKNNLNVCIDAINALTQDAAMLVQAAIDGKLDTRADASKHGGDYQKIVQGVNDTLEGIVVPINEAMSVLAGVANRDLSKQVVGTYRGQLAEFKGNINDAIKNLRDALTQAASAGDQVGSASAQVASSSQQLAEGSAQQASSLEEVSSSLEEMSSMTKQNAGNADQANNLMMEANQVVGRANESMADLTSSMQEISMASEETSKIIKTIDEIAFQTNLLALNAAVEAARAGEAGAGFAVVAGEVKNLAMRAAEAAKNTADLIEGTVKRVGAGSDLVEKTNKEFNEVATSAAKVGELVSEISAASNEQAQGIEQVNKGIAEMDKVTQENAANAEESASASEEMSAQAQELNGMLAEFKLDGEGKQRKQKQIPMAAQQQAPDLKKVAKVQKKAEHAKAAAPPEAVIPMKEDTVEDSYFKEF